MTPLRTGLILAAFVAAALSTVAAVHEWAREPIERGAAERLERELRVVLPDGFDNDPRAEAQQWPNPVPDARNATMTVYPARRDGRLIAHAVRVRTPHGYSGAIELLIGVDGDGRVRAVRTLEHRETPGLGDVIDAERSDWSAGFSGRRLGDPPEAQWRIAPDGGAFDAVTGATRSTRAVTDAVRAVLTALEEEGVHE